MFAYTFKDPFNSSVPTLPMETQHTSLRRRKDQHVQPQAALYSPIMERNEVHIFFIYFSTCSVLKIICLNYKLFVFDV